MTADLRPDERVFLVPKTIGCPGICWQRPAATVVAKGYPYVSVLIDGEEEPRRVHADNVVRKLPVPRAESPAPKAPRRALNLPDGMKEVTLW